MPKKGYKQTKEHRLKLLGRVPGTYVHSEKTRRKIALSNSKPHFHQREGNHYLWKGNKVGYGALHTWVANKLGKAKHCEYCGLDKIPKDRQKYFQWANISKKYLRDLKDWRQLCLPCHKAFDWKEETREKMSRARLGKPAPWKRKAVIGRRGEEVIRFESCTMAVKVLNVNRSSLSGALTKRYKTAGGYKWEYAKK